MSIPQLQIRAAFTDSTITVYQAYRPSIGVPATQQGTFPTEWKRDRMTWIKPSFLWMMYRCGYGRKEGQECVLAIEILRTGFDWALSQASLSHYVPEIHEDHDRWKTAMHRAPVRVQRDPERSLKLGPLGHRSLQMGLSGEATRRYADDWIVSITDVTSLAHQVDALVQVDELPAAQELLPTELPYPIAPETIQHLAG